SAPGFPGACYALACFLLLLEDVAVRQCIVLRVDCRLPAVQELVTEPSLRSVWSRRNIADSGAVVSVTGSGAVLHRLAVALVFALYGAFFLAGCVGGILFGDGFFLHDTGGRPGQIASHFLW